MTRRTRILRGFIGGGGALSGGATVPYSWATGGDRAAKKGIEGALIGGLFGLNGLLDDEEDED